MERRDNPMTITAVLWLRGSLTPDELDELVRARLLPRARFHERVVEHTVAGPRWEPDHDFDLRAHVHHVALPAPGDAAALESLVADLASTPLDPRLPLWQMHLVDGVGDGCALVVRVHHVVADGLALVGVLLDLTDEGEGAWSPPSVPAPRGGLAGAILPLAGLASLVASRPEPSTALVASHGPHKRLAWSRALDLARERHAAHERSVSLTAMLLALVTGAVGRALALRGPLDPALVVRAMVPLSLRAPEDASALGNRYASAFIGLPVGGDDREARVAEVARALRHARVASGVALGNTLVRVAGRVGAPIERLGIELLSRRASLVVSNVPGPREPRHIMGRALRSVVAFAPMTGEVGLGVTFFGYADALTVGVSSGLDDASLPADIVAAVAEEVDALSRDAFGARG